MMATENPSAVEARILNSPIPPLATARIIDYSKTNLGQYENLFAMVIKDIFIPEECAALLSVVQPSPAKSWPPATVPAYNGTQFVDLVSRDCGRIMYESQPLAAAAGSISARTVIGTTSARMG
ncbi:oxidoreductase domain-containing protein [Diaporthe helianthi]|uniref:Oxidoreductase domain-containing protein n=1 Tax=Diaporthe helianthi TaxID=158607 RepID=A0A2P5HQA8_DIAHE|nr:oxidoreductase domain-containing protein [Diaporthe helianthi]